MVKSEWQCLFKQTYAQQNSYDVNYRWDIENFKPFALAVEGKGQIMILIQAISKAQNYEDFKLGESDSLVCGGYLHCELPADLGSNTQIEQDYELQYHPMNFIFKYQKDTQAHYEYKRGGFGYIYTDNDLSGAINLCNEFVTLSWSHEFSHNFRNYNDMHYGDDLINLDEELSTNVKEFKPKEIQIWQYQPGKLLQPKRTSMKSSYKKMSSYCKGSPLNYFSRNMVFEESSQKKIGSILEEYLNIDEFNIQGSGSSDQINQMTLGDFSRQNKFEFLLDLNAVYNKQSVEKNDEEKLYQFKPYYPILKSFEEKKGVYDLIGVAIAIVKTYKNQKSKEIWTLWLEEVKQFSELPEFFNFFSQDQEKAKTIYKLIEGDYDIDPSQSKEQIDSVTKQYEKLYTENVKYTYKIVAEVFENKMNSQLRDQCLNNGTFAKFLDRLGQLTGEKKRKKRVLPAGGELTHEDQVVIKTKDTAKKSDQTPQKNTGPIEKKGVGYTTGNGSAWNVQEYLASKDAKNYQISNIVNILMHIIKLKDTISEENKIKMKELILESALLPILESAMRSGSLLEMAKETQLYNSHLDMIIELSENKDLSFTMLQIDPSYLPEQRESIAHLLKKVSEQSEIFIFCLKSKELEKDSKESESDKNSRILAERIIKTNKIVQERIQRNNQEQDQLKFEKLMSMPLEQAYYETLANLRFEYMSMRKDNSPLQSYNHAYDNQAKNCLNPSQSKIIRLAQEIADLSNSLPCDPTNALFCRVDKERVDLMKVMIMGSEGTPYAHGAFIYDLFFDNNYPNGPPKCLLTTTGGGTVRFNPNLYQNGKVCLSLLGTWRGSQTEMWDPKLSTILQLLLSIQAIIMSTEVYFNEPGYEHEMNKPEGEKKNRGYSNIVKYCNVKFAMIDAIKNPPKGFETVIRRSFYLKKDKILAEVKQWCEEAKEDNANYTGLVCDHNYQWASLLNKQGSYLSMMEQVYKELEQTLNSLENPFKEEKKDNSQPSQNEEKAKSTQATEKSKVDFEKQQKELETIDMSYNDDVQVKNIDIESDQVKDRWSRYIGAMGIEAVAKQAESRVLISQLGALGIEIAKNIVLAGCKEVVIYDKIDSLDEQEINVLDKFSGQFFINNNNTNRAIDCKNKLQELNHYVKVNVVSDIDKYPTLIDYLKNQNDKEQFNVVVCTQEDIGNQEVGQYCREQNISFILCSVMGCIGRVFNDFGNNFKVLEQNSEEIPDVMINKIETKDESTATIKLIEGFKHQFEEGDKISIHEVQGMLKQDEEKDQQIDSNKYKSINDGLFKVTKVINRDSFEIELNCNLYTPYESSGLAKFVKQPKEVKFQSYAEYFNIYDDIFKQIKEDKSYIITLEQIQKAQENFFDENLVWADFEKIDQIRIADFILIALSKEVVLDEDEISELVAKFEEKCRETANKIIQMYSRGLISLAPLNAFLGGIVAQEMVKAMTQKFMPIKQLAIFSFIELIGNYGNEEDDYSKEYWDKFYNHFGKDKENVTQRQVEQMKLFNDVNLVSAIFNCKLFMIGAGAIGCELLKNYSMLGLGAGKDGHITLTDPDVIEVSNLNRQFLFREKHLRKPKSLTAAAAAIQMNPDLKGHISARLDKIHDGTAQIYNEEFYSSQNIVTNALDNVQARLYIDAKCVKARVPMIDSGTLGPKGHVQVVKPFKTESYSSQKDPEVNQEIPHCTLKMFPEETLHCVEWAKDLFGNWFTLEPQSFNKFFFEDEDHDFGDAQVLQTAKFSVNAHNNRPKSFDDCLEKAREIFQKCFYNDILQLLHVYPLDKVTSEGRPFWSLPKRAPNKVEFDAQNELHATFVSSYACLYANMFDIECTFKNQRKMDVRIQMAQKAKTFNMKEFVVDDQVSKEIEQEVSKAQDKKEEQEEDESSLVTQQEINSELLSEIENIKKQKLKQLKVEEFEKDCDENFHIDFIYSMANIRASNYGLSPMDWITVKIKAGRIVPALATTTAAISGLQTIELLKFLKNMPIESYRNSFLNLAVPSLMMGEPGPPQKFKLSKSNEVNLWDRWELSGVSPDQSLLSILEQLKDLHKGELQFRDVFQGSHPIFMYALAIIQTPDITQNETLKKSLKELFKIESEPFIDFTVTMVSNEDPHTILQNVPEVRVNFK